MKKYVHLRSLVFNQPHLCTPEYAETVLAVLTDKLGLEEGAFSAQGEAKDTRQSKIDASGIYTLPIVGSMVHRGGMLDAMSGTMSYEAIQSEIQSAIDDPQVKGILLDIDSSGGAVAGAFDLRDFILQAKKEKPIFALARDNMCSAAYLIGSAATKVYATQTASVGSIGVVAMHMDQSEKMSQKGLKPTFVYAGKYKTAGNPNEPLQGDALDYLQQSVNESYDMFVNAVAEARNIDAQAIRDTEARVYKGQTAKKLGLVDGIRSMKSVSKELADFSQKRVITPTNMKSQKGTMMDNIDTDVEKLQADLTQALAEVEAKQTMFDTLKSNVEAAGFTVGENADLTKDLEEEMIEIQGIPTPKSSIPSHVLEALETAIKEKADADLTAKAEQTLPNFEASVAKELVFKFEGNSEVIKALKAADSLLESKMEEIGETSPQELSSAQEKFDALVEKTMLEQGVSLNEAKAIVTESAEGRALSKQAREEK